MYLELETYQRPETVADCVAALNAPGTAVIAGGTRLNVTGHERIKHLVDLQALPLSGVEADEEGVRIGALTALSDLLGTVEPDFTAIGIAATAERNVAIRNRSTVGGRLSRNRCDARLATAMLALNAQVEVISAEGDELRERILPLGARLSEIAAGEAAGIIASVLFESTPRFSGYVCTGLTKVDAPTTDAALAVCVDGRCRVATGGHAEGADGTLYLPKTSEVIALVGYAEDKQGWEDKVREAALSELPEYTDARASGDFRRDLAATLIVRLVGTWLDGEAA